MVEIIRNIFRNLIKISLFNFDSSDNHFVIERAERIAIRLEELRLELDPEHSFNGG